MIRWALRTCIGLLATLGLASGVRAADLPTRDSVVKSQAILLDGPDWRLAPDPGNKGREGKWFEAPRPDAKATPVPGIVQNVLPDFHGPAWYYREFEAPVNPHKNGRYFVRFGVVDWVAEVWVNGQSVGKHEGGETPFTLEVTEAIKPAAKNLLAVRVLNPWKQKIDGYTGNDTPQFSRSFQITPTIVGCVYNTSGICDSVELLVVPAICLSDVHVMPDWKTGDILIKAAVNCSAAAAGEMVCEVAVEPATGGGTVATAAVPASLKAGDHVVESSARVPQHRLWTTDDPYLYRVTVGVRAAGSSSVHRASVRCGFRDFRFENGYFRLNGRRIFLLGTFYWSGFPLTYFYPHDPELVRRDVANHKKLGFNFMRVFGGRALSRMLDLCDEMGLLVYQEHYGAWWKFGDSPILTARWDSSVREVIRRDRNHPSVVVWGLLNELENSFALKHANASLPMIRELDPTRMVWNNSRRGRPSNPGSSIWEEGVTDDHPYSSSPRENHASMREGGKGGAKKVFISEAGWLGAKDLPSEIAQFRRLGKEQCLQAAFFRQQMDLFMTDWSRWRLDEIWKRPEDYFTEAHRNCARVREPLETAVRSSSFVGYSPTQAICDQGYDGGGLTTFFREPKDALLWESARLANAPSRWCLFATPRNVYRGKAALFEAVLSDLDTLKPGAYPARVQIVGSDRRTVFSREITVALDDSAPGKERPFATAAFKESILLDVPAGEYEMVVTMAGEEKLPGGRIAIYVDDPKTMPAPPTAITLWGEAPALSDWLTQQGANVLPFDASARKRQVVVVGGKPPAAGGARAFGELARAIARGARVVFLNHDVFSQPIGDGNRKDTTGWVPLAAKPTIGRCEPHPLFRADHWAKRHAIFEGLPAGGMIDAHPIYAPLIGSLFLGLGAPVKPALTGGTVVDVVAGGICTSSRYSAGIHVAVCELGAGQFIINTLNIETNLGRTPAADRLLRNMLNYAARDIEKPLVDLPADFGDQLKAMGYE
jgi:hypothetical protein